MKADPAAQLRLLDLQSLDSRADQLRHQRDTLPEIAEIEELTTHQRELEAQRIDQQMVVDDLEVERAKVKVGVARLATQEQLRVLGWREVPTVPDALGKLAREAMPRVEQLFVASSRESEKGGPVGGMEL